LTSQVYLSRTTKPLHIENLNIDRVVKNVRRVYDDGLVEPVVSGCKDSSVGTACVVCGKPVFARVNTVTGGSVMCRFHAVKARRQQCLSYRELGPINTVQTDAPRLMDVVSEDSFSEGC
jgi:hypothetical protein